MSEALRRSVCAVIALATVAVAALAVGTALEEPTTARAQTPGATAFAPVAPCRLFDSRETPNAGRIDRQTWRVKVTGRCGVPAGARAAALNITSTGATGFGFVSVWPAGRARPTVSTLNYSPNDIVANASVVMLSASGEVDVFIHAPTDVVIDVTGGFVDAPGGVSAGRYTPTTPKRLLDTRLTGQRGTAELTVPLPAGVPADATALAVSITVVDAAEPGFVTAYAAGTPRPLASVANADALHRTRANLAFVPVTARGIAIHRHVTADIVVDVSGWFTGASQPSSTVGRFFPEAPRRVWDSRQSLDPVHPNGTVEKQFAPTGAAAVVANVTAADMTASGYVSTYPAGTPRPNVSALNFRWSQPVAALAVPQVSTRGVAFYSIAGAHLVVDVAGWFSGQAVAATIARPSNAVAPGTTNVVFISDSGFAGIRWNGALGYLQGAAWDNRLESCRRLIGQSCRGREGYAPLTAEQEIARRVPAWSARVAVIATGYNDWSGTFPWGLDAVINQARSKGIDRVIWMTYRENVGYVSPAQASNQASFRANNAHLRSVAASGRYPELVIADWHNYSLHRSWWLTADGVHLTPEGARQAAMYTSRKLAFIERRPCPAGIGGVAAPGGWCADPDVTGPP